MTPNRFVRIAALSAVALVTLLTTSASLRSEREVRLRDDCDPASFNGCKINGGTTVDEFIAELTQDG